MIHRSPIPDVQIPSVAVTGFVLARAVELGDKPALIDGPSGRVITYAELDQAVRSLAGGLIAAGFGPGHVLAIMSPNVPEYAVVFHAAALAGGVVTTINPTYTEREVHQGARERTDWGGGRVEDLVDRTTYPAHGGPGLGAEAPAGRHGHPDPHLRNTGRSKLVMQTHRAYAVAGEGFPFWLELTGHDRLLTLLPLFHIHAAAYSTMGSLACGSATPGCRLRRNGRRRSRPGSACASSEAMRCPSLPAG